MNMYRGLILKHDPYGGILMLINNYNISEKTFT